jgi:3-isopropylmalate/(R)-2-methylmalate dehydratase small subunit
MIVKGKTFKYGNNIDTDVIIPARYLNTSEPSELAKFCMEDIDKDFSKKVQIGDIIVGGKNFGCGSSREHAPIAIKASGISCVIAESFGRIFYRNSFNIGLPIIECTEASKKIEAGNEIEIDFETGKIYNITKNEVYMAVPFPEFIKKIIYSEGLVGYVKDKLYGKKDSEGKTCR